MAQHGFKAFLEGRQWSEDLGRQFVDHALGDPMLPDAVSWEELEAYIKRRDPDAPAETLHAAEYVWRLYVAKER